MNVHTVGIYYSRNTRGEKREARGPRPPPAGSRQAVPSAKNVSSLPRGGLGSCLCGLCWGLTSYIRTPALAYLARKLTLVIVLAASSEHPPWEFAATLQQVSQAALQLVWATLQLLLVSTAPLLASSAVLQTLLLPPLLV